MENFENEEFTGRLIPRDFSEKKQVIFWDGDCFRWVWFNAQCNSGAQFCSISFDTDDILTAATDKDGVPVEADLFFQNIQDMKLPDCCDWWDEDYLELAEQFTQYTDHALNEATMKMLIDAAKAYEHNKKFLY